MRPALYWVVRLRLPAGARAYVAEGIGWSSRRGARRFPSAGEADDARLRSHLADVLVVVRVVRSRRALARDAVVEAARRLAAERGKAIASGREAWKLFTDAIAEHDAAVSAPAACITPGCCTCPRMSRCPDCGYTAHDKAILGDHHLCQSERRRKRREPKP